jgi:hypothetical protein
MVTTLNVIGLLANMAGVILLFRYGMPYRISSEGGDYFVTEKPNPESVKWDKVYKGMGFVGHSLDPLLRP